MVSIKMENGFEARNGQDDIERLQAAVHRYCLSLTRSSWDADDLAQEAWLKGLKSMNGNRHANAEALLLRIAKTTWIDQARRQNRLKRIMAGLGPSESTYNKPAPELEEALYGLFRHLSPLQRAVFLLRDVLGYPAADAAELLHASVGAVKAALHRAREALGGLKRELEVGMAALPEDDGAKAFLRSFAAAYENGDTAMLVKLALQDAADAGAVAGMVRNVQLRQAAASGKRRLAKSDVQSVRAAA
ncbi:RNA polymerase sigma factor [Paenibacillus arenilitoris]|uniref:RNA polymerase sigma factor n=1 Tax=Paenibacillus arenilitoris TaxID=2772299 RepID=A0A927CLU9_9BACL|nr:RNA polymerase sigma factor [Paenibacillus arenilitoris]MBD2869934.1 RNA polymerase sigma factor [Paenibacillus arenilitoris]